jgi:S1-C subfamily serine protease
MDVAVLKILPEDFAQGSSDLVSDLPVADLGDSDRLEVGTFVSDPLCYLCY